MGDERHIAIRVHVYAAATLLWLSIAMPAPAGLPVLDSRIDRDPALPVQPIEHVVPPEWRPLWKTALTGPEEDLRRETAEAIVRAQGLGCAGLEEFTEPLRQALHASQNPTVRLTLAAALIALDARDAAPELAALVDHGGDRESLVIEPALARWDYAPFCDVWLSRLSRSQEVSRRRLLLAIEAVRTAGEFRAEDALRTLTLDRRQPTAVRLPAAAALGAVHRSDVAAAAQQLAADSSQRGLVDRLAAVQVLGAERSESAQALLAQLGSDANSAVAAAALQKLLAIDPGLVLPLAPELLQRPDAELRLVAVQALLDEPNAQHVQRLATLLNDPHRDVREAARVALERLGERDELRTAVLGNVDRQLQSADWRGLEQSARLAGTLNHIAAADRLVELLGHEHPEVSITSAWALSRLEVHETLPAILAQAKRLTAGIPPDPADATTARLNETHDACLAHLFELFGVLRYAEAEPLLLAFVPRRYDLGPKSRAAAAWALGHLHTGDPQPHLARLLAERVADDGEIPIREPVEVRASAAISLGRMNVPDAAEVLRAFYRRGNPGDRVREACGWAIEKITGEDLPDPPPKRVAPPAPFLTPL